MFSRKPRRPGAADCAAVQAFVADELHPATGVFTDVDDLYRRFIATTDRVRLPYKKFLSALRVLNPADVYVHADGAVMVRHAFPLNQRSVLP